MRINNDKVSDKDWGAVDKSAMGNKLAAGYEAGDISKAIINEMYAYVPDDAFEDDKFYPTKAKLPHHEIIGNELVINRGGVIAAAAAIAGARGGVDIPTEDLPDVKAHLRRHYNAMDMEPPESLK